MRTTVAPAARTATSTVLVLVATGWLAWPLTLWVVGAAVLLASLVLSMVGWRTRIMAACRAAWWRRRILRSWPYVAEACGLSADLPPPVLSCRTRSPYVQLVVRPHAGQTAADFEAAAESIRTALGLARVRIETVGIRDVRVTMTTTDTLASPFEAVPLSVVDELDAVTLGVREDGKVWRLPVGPHTLVVGSSGSGKGSIFWSLLFGVAPAVADGRVQVHGIDLKGGMEILMGRDLFTSSATTAEEAVAVLEHLVSAMRERTGAYAGRIRQHTPSTDEPLHLVMIDELAALTAYCSERDLQRRAEMAISLLCSQGRAPGFMVVACLQDPRKEVIPTRGLFTQMVGLRLKDASETSMVLGESAVLSGAHCHRIPRGSPGIAYVVPEEGGHPIRVRAGFASDPLIRATAEKFAAPTRIDIPAIERPEITERSRARARSGGARP
jgi:S-DNA-T family DNA segregation ATPase FtsK/SpoIIIE